MHRFRLYEEMQNVTFREQALMLATRQRSETAKKEEEILFCQTNKHNQSADSGYI